MRRRTIDELRHVRQIGRQAATVLERCGAYTIDGYGFTRAMEAVRDDGLVVGPGGVARGL